MEQVKKFENKVTGAKGSDICDADQLAIKAWGKRADTNKNGSYVAFAYLWRRFGPPFWGTDHYKYIANYTLTTADPQVFLTIDIGGSSLALGAGYLIDQSLQSEFYKDQFEWDKKFEAWFLKENPTLDPKKEETASRYWEWRMDPATIARAVEAIGKFERPPLPHEWEQGPPIMKRINQALLDAMKELLRPVGIRDTRINILGRYEGKLEPVESSPFAGFGVPRLAMEELLEKRMAAKK